MKQVYEKPMAYEEAFFANEYVAVCWGVACSIDPANKYDRWDDSVNHRSEHCGLETNQHISTNSRGIPTSMIEDGTDGLGKLTCTLYENNEYQKEKNIANVKAGDYIYWTTSASDGRTWHHQGRVKSTYPGRPNHS